MSIDYGTLNAFAALLWGKYGDVWYAVDGYYYSGRDKGTQKTDSEYADDIQDRFGRFGNEYVKLKTIVDPSAASFITELRKRGTFRVVPADNAVLDGIRETATAMQLGKIKINPELKFFVTELQGYVWDNSAAEDRPVKIKDHACDSCRYFVKTMRIAVKREQKYYSIIEGRYV